MENTYQVTVTLQTIEVLNDHDPLWFNPGEIRFSSCVTPAKDEKRQQMKRFPTVGVFRMHKGKQHIEQEIFQGVVSQGEDLSIMLSGVEEDIFFDDKFERYERILSGDVESWAGKYTPDDEESDPESLADWRLWFQIEVKKTEDIVLSNPDWGPNYITRTLREDRLGENGLFDPNMWNKAIAHTKKMLTPHPLDEFPSDPVFDKETRASLVLGGKSLQCSITENPRGADSLGATGRFIKISGDVDLDDYADLALELNKDELNGIDPASVRVFRWNEQKQRFLPVYRSGVSPNGLYAWGKINKRGTYGVFGLPSNPAERTTLALLESMTDWDTAFRNSNLDHPFVDPICTVILCLNDFAQYINDPDWLTRSGFTEEMGIDPRTYGPMPLDEKGRPIGPRQGREVVMHDSFGRFPGRGNICDKCLGMGKGPGGIAGIPEWGHPGGGSFAPPSRGRRDCTRWQSIGPTNLGGRVQSVAWHPTNSNIVYSGNSQGGVYRSLNGGATWRAMMSGELTLAIGAIGISPSDPDVIYAGTGEHNGFRYQNGVGMYFSTDRGENWDLTGGTPLSNRFSRIIVHPSNSNIAFAAGTSGVERSMDGGETWQLLIGGNCSDIALDPNDTDKLYAGLDNTNGVQVTSNALAATPTWSAMNNGLALTRNHSTNPNNNYIKLATGNDGGTTVIWLQINSLTDPWPGADPPIWTDYKLAVYRWDGTSWQLKANRNDVSYLNWCSTIACEPNNPDVVYAGGVGLAWSSNNGTDWNVLSAGHADQHAIAFDPNNPDKTIIGNDGGLYTHERLATETTWSYSAINTHHVTIQFLNVAVSETGNMRIAGSTQDQGVLTNDHIGSEYDGMGGAEWGPVDVYAKNGQIMMWDPHNDRGPVLQRTEDGGLTRNNADNGLGGRWVNEIAMHPNDSDTVLVATPAQGGNQAAIYKSTDGGAPAPATGFTQMQTFTSNVADITFAPGNPSVVYAVSGNNVWYSGDTGSTWQNLANGPVAFSIASITVDWDDEHLVYITYRQTGIRHVHKGEVDVIGTNINWTDISGRRSFSSLPDVPAHRLIVDKDNDELLYVATDIGVFRSFDGGDWWYSFDEGLPNALVNDMAYRTANNRLYVSTFGRGMYSRKI